MAANYPFPYNQVLCQYGPTLTMGWPCDLLWPMGYLSIRHKQSCEKCFHMGLASLLACCFWKPSNHNCVSVVTFVTLSRALECQVMSPGSTKTTRSRRKYTAAWRYHSEGQGRVQAEGQQQRPGHVLL